MPTIQPLPRSLDPLPDESLPGFLLRLAHRLDLAPGRVAVLTGLGKAVPGRSNMLVPGGRLLHLDAATAAAFAQATRLEAHEVAGLCLDSLRGRYPPLDVSHQADSVARQPAGTTGLARWVLTRSTRYCPQCLAGDGGRIQQAHGGAWEKRWHLPMVFACTIHRRRAALRAWSFPADDWQDLVADLRRRQDIRARVSTSWGKRKRRVASVLVWARVTQGEHRFAPLVLQDRQAPGRSELAQWVQQAIHWSHTGRPEHHYAALMTALDAYADQLATHIDAGWPAELGRSGQLDSVFLAN